MTDQPTDRVASELVERKQYCIAKPGEAGDCFRACLATITGIDARTIPNFNDLSQRAGLTGREGADDMWRRAREFLEPLGLSIFNTYCNGDWPIEKALDYFSRWNPGVPVILHGRPAHSPDPGHSVIALDGKIVHDPSGAGIAGPFACACDAPDCEQTWWHMDVVALIAPQPTAAQLQSELAAQQAAIVAWLRADADLTEAEARGINKNTSGNPRKIAAEWAQMIAMKRGIAAAIERGEHKEQSA